MQETTHTRELPEPLRRRIIAYFKYKYRDGKVRDQEAVLRELPYDMQVSLLRLSSLLVWQEAVLLPSGVQCNNLFIEPWRQACCLQVCKGYCTPRVVHCVGELTDAQQQSARAVRC